MGGGDFYIKIIYKNYSRILVCFQINGIITFPLTHIIGIQFLYELLIFALTFVCF